MNGSHPIISDKWSRNTCPCSEDPIRSVRDRRKTNGTGLGPIPLARRVAEEHGGGVCLEKSNREGTVFTLSLPKTDLYL